MRLSDIIARAKELTGEANPMTDTERVELAGCVFDGVNLISEHVEDLQGRIDGLERDFDAEEERVIELGGKLSRALQLCRELRRHVDAEGLKILSDLERALED